MADALMLLAAAREAFSAAARPKRFAVESPQSLQWGDYEIEDSNALFASRTPDTLQSDEVGIAAGWPENFLTRDAVNYYMPGFVRLALEDPLERGESLDVLLDVLSPNRIEGLGYRQKEAIADVLVFIRGRLVERGWKTEIVDRRLKRLRVDRS